MVRFFGPVAALVLLFAVGSCGSERRLHNDADWVRISDKQAATAPGVSAATLPSTFINARAIIIVRHADIDIPEKRQMGNATPLLPRGKERAKELAFALKDAGVTRIVTTTALRTQETAGVLAKNLKIKLEVPDGHTDYMASGDPKAREQSETLAYLAHSAKPSDVILVVHHHSVIPSLMKELGFPNEPAYTDSAEFDRIYVLLPDRATGTYELLRLRYGGDWHQKP